MSSRIDQDHARRIFDVGLRGVMADRLLEEADWPRWAPREVDAYERIVLIGIGKASMALAGEMEARLGRRLHSGLAIVPEGYDAGYPDRLRPTKRSRILEAAHPVPDERSAAAARAVLDIAAGCGTDDLLILMISGGGSALCAGFTEDVSLADAQAAFRLLLESGADIHAMNAVRKHLSTIGGGRLAAAAGCDLLALVVSDVVGDDLSVIASGPTVPDPTTAAEAIDVLHAFDIWPEMPASVRFHLERVRRDPALETPGADSPVFDRVRTELLGTNRNALAEAASEAERLGYAVDVVTHDLTGEAREAGAKLAREGRRIGPGRCLLYGGETTVTVRGDGRGGRNQELALSAAIALEGAAAPIALLSAGTDGRDGPTPAAGAVATEDTASLARDIGAEPEGYLNRNDAFTFWERVGGHVTTGPTHTNVMDLQVVLRSSAD